MSEKLNEVVVKEIIEVETKVNQIEERYDSITNTKLLNEIKKSSTEEEFKFLQENSLKLFKLEAKSKIEVGEILSNVFEKLNCQGSKDKGIYEKWLLLSKISKSTALRLRKRYEIYKIVKEESREIIGFLPQNYIDEIYESDERDTYIEEINKGVNAKVLIEFIKGKTSSENKTSSKVKTTSEAKFNFEKSFFNYTSDIKSKIETLDKSKKRRLEDYLKKIEELLA